MTECVVTMRSSLYGAFSIHYDREVGRFILLLVGIEVCRCRYGMLVLRRPSWFTAEEGRGACFFAERGVVGRDVKTSTPKLNTKSSVK
jgi:hypothetical protein